jgi:peptide chain release factor 1
VQRVPATESQGRVHTSTATVAVLPKVQQAELEIDTNDVKMELIHASGHGGQNVNKVATAVRLTHLPSKLVVVCQNERSQIQNRRQAMDVLRSRLWEKQLREEQESRANIRRSQIRGGERSEKIRTYNFPQNRVTDHRISYTSHRLREILGGELDEMINTLLAAHRVEMLAQIGK